MYPLAGKAWQQALVLAGALAGKGVNGEPQHSGKAQAAQNAQGVLVEPQGRLAHAAKHPVFQIRQAGKGIKKAQTRTIGHGVYGKVPAGQVLGQAGGKQHLPGLAVVFVVPVYPKGGNFGRAPREQQGNRAMGGPGQGGPAPWKGGKNLLGQGRGDNVPVCGGAAQKGVSHTAPHAPGLKALAVQAREDKGNVAGRGEGHGKFPFYIKKREKQS